MLKERLYADYADYHKDSRNRRAHAVGIPLIVFGLLGLLAKLHAGPIDLAVATAVAVLIYYASIDIRGAVISAVCFALLYAIAIHVPWSTALGAFVLGWVFQLVGHVLEGNKPKFLESLTYLLIGPLYFFQEVYGGLLTPRRTL